MSRILIVLSFLLSFSLLASQHEIRFTYEDTLNADTDFLISKINEKISTDLTKDNFLLIEDRPLGLGHFKMLSQVRYGFPLKSHSLRIWTDRNGYLVQAEAVIEDAKDGNTKALLQNPRFLSESFSSKDTLHFARNFVSDSKLSSDKKIKSVTWKDSWEKERLVRDVVIKASYGKYLITVDLKSRGIRSSRYEEYPREDLEYFSVPAKVYPIYEEVESSTGGIGPILPRIDSELRYLKKSVPVISGDPYAPLKEKEHLYSKLDPILAQTPEGQAQGYWSLSVLKSSARNILESLPKTSNGNGRILLDGKFATVSIHPNAFEKFSGIEFPPTLSPQYKIDWLPTDPQESDYQIILKNSYYGRPFLSAQDILNLPARRLADHNPAGYINDGFDEIQVYWAINTFFETLHSFGFIDPELSTRPFNAFLFDPDISMRDNAFYTDDTINFTTYSSTAINYARDNSTIWHELGHGLMDRLMGDNLVMADTGGLSEGMADLTAQMIINHIMWGQHFLGEDRFRIINKTGFFLTNEVHDDGEAYGGAMYDMMLKAQTFWGHFGLAGFSSLVLESMRLTRNHPALTAYDWFSHMLFVDKMRGGLFKDIILNALAKRNFNLDGGEVAEMKVLYDGDKLLTSKSDGSRERPIRHELKDGEVASHDLFVSLKSTDSYKFTYPALVKFSYDGGPLQGAVHWEGEPQNNDVVILNGPEDVAHFTVKAHSKCDYINREDNSCSDFVYIQVFSEGAKAPLSKKRFYLRIYPKS